jgi:DNA-binding winged helix-turn-helix (wHTH) protein/TolB-like protein/Tfp pilus assembly protein PilF
MHEGAKLIESEAGYEFDRFRVYPANRLLLREGEVVPLTSKVFDILLVFVENGGCVLEKEEMMRRVWQDSFVEEGNLTRNVSTLRKALGEDPKSHQYIVTVPGRGYKFVAAIRSVQASGPQMIVEERTVSTTVIEEELSLSSEVITTRAVGEIKEDGVAIAQKTRSNRASIFIIAPTCLALIALIALMLSRREKNPASQNTVVPKSIAVLPLKSLNAAIRDPVYELGIADSLILKLSAVKELIVRPLSATRKYTNPEQDPLAAGREQQVDYVLSPSYQLAAGKIRVTAQLFTVRDGSVVSIFKCDESCADIFATQDAISEKIGQMLLTRVTIEQNNLLAKRYTSNEEAYRLYLQGKYLADRRKLSDAEQAIVYFEQAIKLDPDYALAYAGLAYAHRSVSSLGSAPREEYPKSLAAVAKALALDGNLAEAHAILGEIKLSYEWDFPGAEQELRKAIALNPSAAQAHLFFGFYLCPLGHHDEAVAEMKTDIELDPTNPFYHRALGQVLYHARRYDEAIVQLRRSVEIDASYVSAYHWLQWAYEMKGDYDQAFDWFLQDGKPYGPNIEERQRLKTIYAKSGWRGVLQQRAETINEQQYVERACLYAQLGEKGKAFVALEKAYEIRELGITFTQVEPRLDRLRSDPRFDELVRRVGLR